MAKTNGSGNGVKLAFASIQEIESAVDVADDSGVVEVSSVSRARDIRNGSSENTTDAASGERVVYLPIIDLYAPDDHPFLVKDDEAMERLVESVKRDGVREPGIARKRADGAGYELLCGNRRRRACELAGIETMPVIVRELDDDQAVIVMIDSNLDQRERILPSEKAWAYKVKMAALNHNGVKGECHAFEVMVKQTGESKNTIFRTIRLTELLEVLLDKVDAKQLAFNPAVELSYLSFDEQRIVADCMAEYEMRPSLSQAKRLKVLKQESGTGGALTAETIREVLSAARDSAKAQADGEGVAEGTGETGLGLGAFKSYFPAEYTPEQMSAVIVKLLTGWQSGAAAA